MLPGLEMIACPNLAAPAEVMRHIVNVESGSNPYAIGVVGGRLVHQPQNLGEALATVRMLEDKGYNYSLGVAQVNRNNLGKYGLDTYEKAFSRCANLAAGARILAACYNSSGGDWGKSFSCYYSGNFVTGYRDGYVQKVYDSINRGARTADPHAVPIQLVSEQNIARDSVKNDAAPIQTDSAAYRVAIRSVVLDAATTQALVPVVAAASKLAVAAPAEPAHLAQADSSEVTKATEPASSPVSQAKTVADSSAAAEIATADDIFVPQVRGPNDPLVPTSTQSAKKPAEAPSSHSVPPADQSDLRQGGHDAAFVF